MQEQANIGLDFGSLGWRAGRLVGGEVTPLCGSWNDTSQWVSCELSPGETPGVRFPTVKNQLGLPSRPRVSGTWDARAVARKAFAELRRAVEQSAGHAPGGLVIAVPALYRSSHRDVLRELALEAGFASVRLVNDSMAALVANTRRRAEASSFLVFGMGYGGFEAALIRREKNQLSALSYDGGNSPGGAAFDASIVNGFHRALYSGPFRHLTRLMSCSDWLAIREGAGRLKEMLLHSEMPTRRLWLSALGHNMDVTIARYRFERSIAPGLRAAVEAAESLVSAAGLRPSDLSDILLVGGCANLRLLQEMVTEQFLRRPVLLPADSVMCGTTILANHFELSAEVGQPPAGDIVPPTQPRSAIPLTEMSLSYDADAEAAPQPNSEEWPAPAQEGADELAQAFAHRRRLFESTRRLIGAGEHEGAAGLMEGLIEEAGRLLASIPSYTPRAAGGEQSQLILEHARSLLESGQFHEAVAASHDAYELSKSDDNPDAYLEMIEIHCRAAATFETIEGYEDSIRLLLCAYKHDRSNSAIHELLAQRHFIHARQLAAAGARERENVLKALEKCLLFKPDHKGAKMLRAELDSTA